MFYQGPSPTSISYSILGDFNTKTTLIHNLQYYTNYRLSAALGNDLISRNLSSCMYLFSFFCEKSPNRLKVLFKMGHVAPSPRSLEEISISFNKKKTIYKTPLPKNILVLFNIIEK